MTGFNLYDLTTANDRHRELLQKADQARLIRSLRSERPNALSMSAQWLTRQMRAAADFVRTHSMLYARGLRQKRSLLR